MKRVPPLSLTAALVLGGATASFAQQSTGSGAAPAQTPGTVQTEPPPNVAAPQQGSVNSAHHAPDYRGTLVETPPGGR